MAAGSRPMHVAWLCAGALALLALCAPTRAQSPAAATPQRIVITGAVEPLVEKSELTHDAAAGPASVTVLKPSDDKKFNTRDYTELLKPIVGVAANNFDQGGIGFGFTMRGFSERSNGGGVAYTIDGVPVNLPSHPLTNGYGDLTPLIPELLDRAVLTRGPFDVRFGANSLGGSIAFQTQDDPAPAVAVGGGSYDYLRGYATTGLRGANAHGYIALLGSTLAGYRDNSFLDVTTLLAKATFALPGGQVSVRAQLFSDRFGAPGYLRRDLVENGTLAPRGAINTTDGGSTELQVLSLRYRQDGSEPLSATFYAMRSQLDRYSNRQSTVPIALTLPGQALQIDDRVTFGASVEKYWRWGATPAGGVDLLVGGGVRVDDATSQLFNTVQRVRGTQTEDTDFRLTNPFVYLQSNFKPAAWLKLTAGVRYDRLEYDIDDRTRALVVSPGFGVTQPKAGIVVTPWRGLDIYANYGRSFLPPSAIGGQLSRDPALRASELATRELGVQWRSPDGRWELMADVYRTTFSNEIQNRTPPLLPIYLGPSTRNGWDAEVRHRFWRSGARALSAFVNYSKLDGELVNRATGAFIPDVAEWFAKVGVDWSLPLRGDDDDQFTLSLAQGWEGPKPLTTTNSLSTKTFSRIDLKLTYTRRDWNGARAHLGAIVYPDRRLDETAFTFGTPVTVGVSPKAPLTVQAGLFIPF